MMRTVVGARTYPSFQFVIPTHVEVILFIHISFKIMYTYVYNKYIYIRRSNKSRKARAL